ncbi:unnamed protein product [Acanthoscelides obtectus]|uniref:Uncharacterized protein n=1 Tax=Acanthoscelides obtectus TaxID=200917 RepID=A0A9P0K346_ACAOB|nr:unnamed protein product [Acanthoscelides obtectus]CAK1628730.1 hypothetical protein AOBTE_LOCUS5369 [Acanthoscelides obtectus]
MFPTGQKQSVFALEEKDLCHTLPKYVGDFFYDMEKKAKMPVGICPIKRGNYTVENAFIDLEKFKIKMFLEGSFYAKLEFSKGPRTLGCMEDEFKLSPK